MTKGVSTTTTQGTYNCNKVTFLHDITFPEFVNGRHMQGVAAHIFDSPTCLCDVTLRRDFILSIGLKIDFQNVQLDTIVEMKHVKMSQSRHNDLQPFTRTEFLKHVAIQNEIRHETEYHELLCDDNWDCFSSEIMERKCQEMTTHEVASLQKHLTQQKKCQLQQTLDQQKILIDGKLGCYPYEKVHLELIDDYKPSCKKACPTLFARDKVLKKELDALVEDKVLERVTSPSNQASPTFIVPKKDS